MHSILVQPICDQFIFREKQNRRLVDWLISPARLSPIQAYRFWKKFLPDESTIDNRKSETRHGAKRMQPQKGGATPPQLTGCAAALELRGGLILRHVHGQHQLECSCLLA